METIETIRQEMAEKTQKIDPIGKKLKFVLDNEVILIDGTSGKNIVSNANDPADCTITMSIETFGKLKRKEIKPMMATLTGKIKVKGDLGLARKLKELS